MVSQGNGGIGYWVVEGMAAGRQMSRNTGNMEGPRNVYRHAARLLTHTMAGMQGGQTREAGMANKVNQQPSQIQGHHAGVCVFCAHKFVFSWKKNNAVVVGG